MYEQGLIQPLTLTSEQKPVCALDGGLSVDWIVWN
jgi:hypothetical protein